MNTFELALAVLSSAAYRVGRERPNYAPIVPGAAPLLVHRSTYDGAVIRSR